MVASRSRSAGEAVTRQMLRHWQEAVPNDRLAHLVKHAARGLARALQMEVVAEGVENAAQAQQLQALGADSAQGYWFSRALDARAFQDLVSARKSFALPVQATAQAPQTHH